MPLVAHYGQIPPGGMDAPTVSPRDVVGRAIIGRQPIHLHDLAAAEVADEFPDSKFAQERSGARTFLTMPMLREGTPVGVINIRRQEVRPFSEKHIALLKTLPTRRSSPSRTCDCSKRSRSAMRNCARRWSIRRRRPKCSASSAARRRTCSRCLMRSLRARRGFVGSITYCCDSARETVWFRGLISVPIPAGREISIDEPRPRWVREHGTLHIPDVREQNDFRSGRISAARDPLFVPLRQKGEFIGALSARRIEVRPFTPAQIKLLETFADQAVIAIENVRLFQELKESLEQQTATSEILGVIASSPTDIQPVLNTVAENAARLCEANDAAIWRAERDKFWLAASHGSLPVSRPRKLDR